MIRITELSLPLDSDIHALRRAIVKRLRISDAELLDFKVYKRSYDARRKNSSITFVHVIDLVARDEAALLERLAGDPHEDGRGALGQSIAPAGQLHCRLRYRG